MNGRLNGCICEACADSGLECTNVAPPGEDICLACATDHHERERVDLTLDVPNLTVRHGLYDMSLEVVRCHCGRGFDRASTTGRLAFDEHIQAQHEAVLKVRGWFDEAEVATAIAMNYGAGAMDERLRIAGSVKGLRVYGAELNWDLIKRDAVLRVVVDAPPPRKTP